MSQINFDQTKEFLNKITDRDKVIIFYHDDLDGISSGIMIFDFLKSKGVIAEHKAHGYENSLFDFGNLENFNKILVVDIGPNKLMVKDFSKLKDKEILYIDHHPSEIEVPEYISYCKTSSPISASRTSYELTGIKKWLGIAGVVADAGDLYKENEELIGNFLKEERINLEKFRKEVVNVISNFLVYFDGDLDSAFEILEKINSYKDVEKLKEYSDVIEEEIQNFVKKFDSEKEKIGDVTFYYMNPKFRVMGGVLAILTRRFPNKTLVLASPKKDGIISISARNQTRKVSMPDLLKKGVEGLKDSNSGGHIPAAGGYFKAEDLEKFKENLRKIY